jgi:hypothetical protein
MNSVSAIIMTEVLPRLQITSADTRLTYANILAYSQRVYEDLFYSIVQQNPTVFGTVGYVKFYANNLSAQLSANLTDYDISQDFLQVDIKDSTSAEYYRAIQVSWNDLNNHQATVVATNPVFSVFGDLIYIGKELGADTVSCGRVYYTKRASALSGSMLNVLPSGWENALILGVCQHGFDQLGESSKATKFLQEYQIEKNRKLREVSNRNRITRMRDIRENYFGTFYNS